MPNRFNKKVTYTYYVCLCNSDCFDNIINTRARSLIWSTLLLSQTGAILIFNLNNLKYFELNFRL